MKALLDTSVLLAGDVPPLEGDLAISAASLAELHFGVLVTRDDGVRAERLRRLSLIERNFDSLPIDDAVARGYGRLAARVAHRGARVTGLLIAATALAHDARLYTRNPDDLAGLDDVLEIVTVPVAR